MLLRILSTALLTLTLSACSSLEFPWVYRISVQQGNIIDQEDINKLELGMTKRQVQFVLGSPILIDTFNPDRWDYVYSRRSGKGKTTEKQFTVFFEDGKYIRHEGNVKPTPADAADNKDSAMPRDTSREGTVSDDPATSIY
ncbi:outer membrane protein assembly factor BamE [Marinagarivorans algicola]|uniref:outer membrane protein assembly factor BamE n=1 Tax=Marinagarivorans algicola TaxID=1513270 RepID=UPI0009E9C73B|nr:outer membrane protein assembly factor BamE [Marinagarivorans algicola]